MVSENELKLSSPTISNNEKQKFQVANREEPLDVLHYLIKKK